ncbi:cytochrome P450 [Gonapodya prolifera JEL478]|uniref:Cytochrome P450 n=1 Tax=Gonapodya prolifera (strain JEL478) TaxID=1344416 RepID=A0A139ARV7_GONPJ|nr:cytochrome P450 [Gonapodya prolifera JEL478]|eukprot:KXS19449.1 cytochrome P450 [Gonapodya prolifera JEL478]
MDFSSPTAIPAAVAAGAIAFFFLWGLLFASPKGKRDPPNVSLVHFVRLLLRDHRTVFIEINKHYGPVAVIKIPLLGKIYLMLGSQVVNAFHRTKALNFMKAVSKLTGHFTPDPQAPSGTPEIAMIVNRMLADPFVPSHIADEVKTMTQRDGWAKGGEVVDVFSDCYDLVMAINLRCLCDVAAQSKTGMELKALVMKTDIERLMQQLGTHLNRAKAVREVQDVYKRMKAILQELYDEKSAATTKSSNDYLVWIFDRVAAQGVDDPMQRTLFLLWGFLFAAQLNTYANLAWLLVRIAHDPKLAARLMDEQRDVLAQYKGTDFRDAIPTVDELNRMSLLERVMFENIRLTAPGVAFRVLDEDFSFNDCDIPAGSMVGYSHPSLHLDESIYGANAKEFDPDRKVQFMQLDGKIGLPSAGADTAKEPVHMTEGSLHTNYNVAVFGLGRHPCVGAKFAIMETKIAISLIIRRYNLLLKDDVFPKVSMTQFQGIYRPTNKVGLCLKERVY